MMPRAGFTLLEVVVAVVVGSVVALVAWGTVAAGRDTGERISARAQSLEAHMIVRTLLSDALRHPLPSGGTSLGDTIFALWTGTTPDGLPADAVRLVSRGLGATRGAGGAWSVLFEPTADGARFTAVPLGDARATPLQALLRDVAGVEVRVLDRAGAVAWLDAWPHAGRAPAAVRVRLLDARGRAAAPDLVMHAAPEPLF
jgi:prepilin-type N-terminal cleavage/methylation domain-containing protein